MNEYIYSFSGKKANLRNILHCDMNNFYASVECMLEPKLKNYPVAVCGRVEDRHGIVLAKNYHAKKFDVATGDTVWMAKKKCPELVIVEPHFDEYLKYSSLAKQIYCQYTDMVEPFGLDECWLDVTASELLFGAPDTIAQKIRETIKNDLGLTISVGVSFNKIFAKLGSDMKKPDAVTVINHDDFKEKIWNLPVCNLFGVGRATDSALKKVYINTIGDLARCDPAFLQSRFGKNGVKLWQYANGADDSEVEKIDYNRTVKSVGHGTTTPSDLKNNDEVWKVILQLTQDIAHRLKAYGLRANGVSVSVRDCNFCAKQWQKKLESPSQCTIIIAKSAFELFRQSYKWNKDIRSVTVTAIDLVPKDIPKQDSVFSDSEKTERLEKLDNCIEQIRNRFGKSIIKNAVLCGNDVRSSPLSSVAFSKANSYI
ncbi:MAG: DNA polymerase IV [Clostridiales bacterium]|nr:DNA polymerase IV [Clostridiales bacterium]